MPVSTGLLGEPRVKRCKLCDESNNRSETSCGYWQLQLDRDLVDTISAIYPEWFKHNMAEGGGSSQATRETSPKAVVDTSPLHIDQNKESLKVKLMLRRPLDQLVAQGIMPPHKTPAAYHGQRRQLERAKTGDLLKAKIQQRPSRQELERRHILELDLGHVDPSLAERQRMLKKARLADQLNDQLSHRPGPLELIRKNILHTEEPIEQAVKTGIISYKATSEGQLNRPQLPSSYITPEDDSQSSAEGDLLSPGASDAIETAAKSAGIVVSLIPATEGTVVLTTSSPLVKDKSEIVFADICRSVTGPLLARTATSPASLGSTTSTLSPLSSVASPVPTILSQPSTPIPPPLPPVVLTPRPLPSPAKSDAPGKDKNRKKSKSKSIPKARTIKFHEYKGPPSAQKNTANNNFSGESSYELLLQQQTLFLQFQLQLQHKFPQIILPASQESQNENSNINQNNSLNNPLPSPAPSTSSESSSVANRVTGRLEDMKVSDLKAELKRRNLPVSGSKPQLIERLKLFSNNQIEGCNQTPESVHSNSSIDQPQNSPTYQEHGSPEEIKDETTEHMEIGDPSSPLPTMIIKQEPNYLQNQKKEISQRFADDLVKEQQRKIHELQRELTLSQLKLQAATRSENKAQVLALQKHLHAKQQQQATSQIQQLQARQARQLENEEEQKRLQQQQQQHVAFQNQKNLTNGLILNGVDAQLILNQLIQGKVKLENNNQRSNSLPNFFNSIVTPIIPTEVKNGGEEIKPPPLYEEATKQLIKKNNVKSQIVDDVLEILIKNGELPPSAAQEPVTPNSAEIKTAEPVYTEQNQTINDNQDDLGLDPNELLNSLENLDNMDLSQFVMDIGVPQQNGENNNENDSVPMDTDEWLESLLPSSDNRDNVVTQQMLHEPDLSGYDPLLGISHDPFDPFNLDEFRSTDLTSLSWDKLDYAA